MVAYFLKWKTGKRCPSTEGREWWISSCPFKELGRSPFHTNKKQKAEQVEKINNYGKEEMATISVSLKDQIRGL